MRELEHAFGVYVHVPFCRRLCSYCDFNVHMAKRADWRRYFDAVLAELEGRAPVFEGRRARSLYFGGGTPSLAPLEGLARVIERVRTRFDLEPGAEITVEVDPATLDGAGFVALRRLGVTRLSLGWQSTHDAFLKALGRGHTAADSEEALGRARAAGFTDLSLDLIFAVPGETMAHLERDLDAVERLAPSHVSLYALTYHEGTELFRRRAAGRVVPVDEDLEAEMMLRIDERLSAAGFEHYEVSNYARAGHRSLHNQLYWQGARYLGVGPGAHSFAREDWRRGWRWESTRLPAAHASAWLDRTPPPGLPEDGDPSVSFVEQLSAEQLQSERVLLGLRLADGLSAEGLAAGLVGQAIARGWLTRSGTELRPTAAGLMNADAVADLIWGRSS